MSEGLRWARSVLHEVAALFTLAALTIGVTVGGVLLHRPAWFLGVFGVVLLLVVLGEGAYRVWREAHTQAQSLSTEDTGLSLVDRLRLALKRGEGFEQEVSRGAVPAPPALLALARDWHDDIYKMLLTDGEREEGKRWLNETAPVPEIQNLTLASVGATGPILKQQVKCLEEVISRLEARDQ